MIFTWFTHQPMPACEAKALLERYRSQGKEARSSLSDDPRFFIVEVKLPQTDREPIPSSIWQSRMWR